MYSTFIFAIAYCKRTVEVRSRRQIAKTTDFTACEWKVMLSVCLSVHQRVGYPWSCLWSCLEVAPGPISCPVWRYPWSCLWSCLEVPPGAVSCPVWRYLLVLSLVLSGGTSWSCLFSCLEMTSGPVSLTRPGSTPWTEQGVPPNRTVGYNTWTEREVPLPVGQA